ncbi:alpha/beta hydrolase [Microbulbifer epialgicus]|uniref:Proline iminopeptidase n=1 Tax=Microbulbifer epialgicus TaxID=393907 RepID=A0ABV4P418_9GAMM
MKNIRLCFLALFTIATSGYVAAASNARQETACCAQAADIISELHSIVAPGGIEIEEALRIGGIKQFVSVRGRDSNNPVLLVIHGGPGWVSSPISWWVSQGWDEYFTVIHWDQRGAGKTYTINDPDVVAPTMTRQRMDADVDEIVQWARSRFDKDRIFVLGHSWGSILGLALAERHPEWLHAYIGVGQAIDFYESERRGWRWTLNQAKAANNSKAIEELASLSPYAVKETRPLLEELLLQRKWLNHYGGAAYKRADAGFESAAFRLSPIHSVEDVSLIFEAQKFSMTHLLGAAMEVNFGSLNCLETPMFLFLGRHDYNVSSTLAAEWSRALESPYKEVVWFEHSAHEILAEEPGKVFITLVEKVLPIATDTSGFIKGSSGNANLRCNAPRKMTRIEKR